MCKAKEWTRVEGALVERLEVRGVRHQYQRNLIKGSRIQEMKTDVKTEEMKQANEQRNMSRKK